MGRADRHSRACGDYPPPMSAVEEIAGLFARGIMRRRDKGRDMSRDSTRSLRLMPDAGEVDCHAQVSPAAGASTVHEPAAASPPPP